MSHYLLTWLTESLATGYAPMSYSDLESIKAQGIDVIVNLCGEYCDLHELEEKSGFEVYYLPIPDESAPDLDDMEAALAWMDEAILLGKKILVHCRHGIGRTGTFVTSYLLRKGLGLKKAQKKLKNTRANPTSYPQWKLLKKYNKKSGILKTREPTLENPHRSDLSDFFAEYEMLVKDIDRQIAEMRQSDQTESPDEKFNRNCCYCHSRLTLIEAVYLSNRMNKMLKSEVRKTVIGKAVELVKTLGKNEEKLRVNQSELKTNAEENIPCPLCDENGCSIFEYRPISCRIRCLSQNVIEGSALHAQLQELSQKVFNTITGQELSSEDLEFSLAQTVSGKFIQTYFNFLVKTPR